MRVHYYPAISQPLTPPAAQTAAPPGGWEESTRPARSRPQPVRRDDRLDVPPFIGLPEGWAAERRIYALAARRLSVDELPFFQAFTPQSASLDEGRRHELRRFRRADDGAQVELFPPFPLFFREGWQADGLRSRRPAALAVRDSDVFFVSTVPTGWDAVAAAIIRRHQRLRHEDQVGISPPFPLVFPDGWQAQSVLLGRARRARPLDPEAFEQPVAAVAAFWGFDTEAMSRRQRVQRPTADALLFQPSATPAVVLGWDVYDDGRRPLQRYRPGVLDLLFQPTAAVAPVFGWDALWVVARLLERRPSPAAFVEPLFKPATPPPTPPLGWESIKKPFVPVQSNRGLLLPIELAFLPPMRTVRTGKPLVARVQEADSTEGKRRLDRFTQLMSEMMNSLSVKGRIARIDSADWEVVAPGGHVDTRAPSAIDDGLSDYRVGSIWVAAGVAYVCTDNTTGHAVWKAVQSSTGTGLTGTFP